MGPIMRLGGLRALPGARPMRAQSSSRRARATLRPVRAQLAAALGAQSVLTAPAASALMASHHVHHLVHGESGGVWALHAPFARCAANRKRRAFSTPRCETSLPLPSPHPHAGVYALSRACVCLSHNPA